MSSTFEWHAGSLSALAVFTADEILPGLIIKGCTRTKYLKTHRTIQVIINQLVHVDLSQSRPLKSAEAWYTPRAYAQRFQGLGHSLRDWRETCGTFVGKYPIMFETSISYGSKHARERNFAAERPHDRVLTTLCSAASGARRCSGTAGGMVTVTRSAFNPWIP
jgi:hypothetical protein